MNGLVSSRFCFPLALVLGLLATATVSAGVVDFEDLTPSTSYAGGGAYWNGPASNGYDVRTVWDTTERVGTFQSGGVEFVNRHDLDYGSWSGFAYSNTSDTTKPGYENQYSAFTGTGTDHTADPGKNYGVFCQSFSSSPTVILAPGSKVLGAWITNTTYAALSMLNGDEFAKAFGGDTGDDADWFKLSISGNGASNPVDFFLADYSSADNSHDYIVDEWTWVDLTALGDSTELTFTLSSSDSVPDWGINTPGFFAIDDISIVPEPGAFTLLGLGGMCLVAGSFARRRFRRRPSTG